MPRQRATAARHHATQREIRALASPTRLRILRLTLDEAMTNHQLAQHLRITPASAHYHVRRLVDAGLLEAQAPRARAGGGIEVPYRSLGRSWHLDIADEQRPNAAILDAFLAELTEIGTRLDAAIRYRPVLNPRRKTELVRRVRLLLDEFAEPDPDGTPWSVFFAVHADVHPDPPPEP